MSQELVSELPSEEELIFDWNCSGEHQWPAKPPSLVDHSVACATVRWQSFEELSVEQTVERSHQVLSALSQLGIEGYQLGEWDAPATRDLMEQLLQQNKQSVNFGCELGSRPLIDQLQNEAPPETSPLRFYTSARHPKFRQHCQLARSGKVLVVQDCGWQQPSELVEAVSLAVEFGFEAICLSDDTGRCLPSAATRLVFFVRDCLERRQPASLKNQGLRIEWSGRNDRGMALYTGLAAWKAGASVLHCAYLGIGEGAGLLSTELLLVNLSLIGCLQRDLSALKNVSETLAKLLNVELYANLPVVGIDAFRTGTGVHAAAIVKAHRKGHDWLADLIYSGIPATRFGYSQIIEIGPMAGASNVIYWLRRNGHPTDDQTVQAILQKAKLSERVLSDQELLDTLKESGVKA